MVKFYPNFKSIKPKIANSLDIDSIMGTIIRNQHLLDCHTTPHEMKKWDKQELDSFKIEYSQIDRLYIFTCHGWYNDEISYSIIIRIKYKDESDIYVYLTTGYIIIDENYFIYGSIYISKNVKVFMRIFLRNLDNVYKLLEYDDIYLKSV